ncbi:MAG: hypothetical protein ACL7AX_02135 [Candidatus Arsenophonus phytopathogenicus]
MAAKILQDLRYQYDPVGNMINVRNDAEPTRFSHNQKVIPENTYTYIRFINWYPLPAVKWLTFNHKTSL